MMKHYDFVDYGYVGAMHHGFSGHNIMCMLICAVVFIDLVLLGIWLWKRISKDDCHHHNHDHNH
jgi:uncharacterized membrane protein